MHQIYYIEPKMGRAKAIILQLKLKEENEKLLDWCPVFYEIPYDWVTGSKNKLSCGGWWVNTIKQTIIPTNMMTDRKVANGVV